jgi:hypothetical protein
MAQMTTKRVRTERERTVDRLFEEHVRAELPVRWRTEDMATVDLAFLDDQIAGCVATWLSSAGRLDAGRLSVLRDGLRDIDRVLPSLTDNEEALFANRLRQLCSTGS